MNKFEQILSMIFYLYIFFCQEQMLFYSSMKKYCKKNNGNCENCICWSCPRKLYIDEYRLKKNVEDKDI